jgi:hypothetical protein
VNERFKERKARRGQLEKELAQLQKQRKVLERDLQKSEPEEWAEPRRPPPRSAAPRDGEPVSQPRAGGLPDGGPALESEERERFAAYLSLGSNTPQLRQERRRMRNKAIVMAIIALVLLISLIHFMVK